MSHDPVQILEERFATAMRAAFGDSLPEGAQALVAAARSPEHGDFQSNAAMPLAKQMGMKPRDVAARIVEHIDLSDIAEPLTEASIAGPGFINVRLLPDTLANLLSALDTPALGVERPSPPKTVVVDLCGVNLAKQMHVGHLRASVIGDALARVFERLGHDVLRQNHFGDWGLPIAMVTAAVKARAERGELSLDGLSLDDLDDLYRGAQKACAPEHTAMKVARKYDLGPKVEAEIEAQIHSAEQALAHAKSTLVSLQSGDEETVAVWQRIADITVAECVRTFARLRTTVLHEHTAGESTYRETLPWIVEDLLSRGVAEVSQGAVIVR
ncbi:MAG: arginine--tRNA ligase, partial [Planctomycetota bacterium]|nr:arginine--tRNA ligase [Planctomycetota bacterium]